MKEKAHLGPFDTTLREEYQRLLTENAHLATENARLRERLRDADTKIERLERQCTRLTDDCKLWRNRAFEIIDRYFDATSPAAPRPEAWVGHELKNLAAIAHPDKWSQGQPATALAHEVVVMLTTLREKLEGQA